MNRVGRAVAVFGVVLALCGCEQSWQQPLAQSADAQGGGHKYKKVRGPAVAGAFYERHREDLAKQIDGLLKDADPKSVKGLRGLVCPHAGYRFSGPTAAFGYKLLVGSDIDTVVVLAPSHCAIFEGASIADADAYETPLGMIPVSPKAAELAKLEPFVVNPTCEVRRPGWWRVAPKELPPFGQDTPHSWEHSLEVQLPFLQQTLKDFALVPIVYGQDVDPEAAAKGLERIVDDNTLIVASSDLSHYLPYETAKGLDTTCCRAICSLNTAWMQRQDACGKVPILTLMYLARRKGWTATLLDYRNSGDTAGEKSNVVGYAAVAFCKPDGNAVRTQVPERTGNPGFSELQQQFLLKLARKTVTDVVNRGRLPQVDAGDVPAGLDEPRACFVTLTKQGQLRGCIGSIFPRQPLCQGIIHSAASAAVRDRRFPPVKPSELAEIEIEVSVLTLPEPLLFKSPEELLKKLRPGVDGVVLRVGQHESTYLPQVWEQIPGKEQFLSRLAEKAGLKQDAWRTDGATVLVYQVKAFEESEHH